MGGGGVYNNKGGEFKCHPKTKKRGGGSYSNAD